MIGDIKLTSRQLEAYESLNWLLSPSRREGKTFVYCCAMLSQATARPNEWINMVDHYATTTLGCLQHHVANSLREVYTLARLDEDFDLHFNRSSQFKLVPKFNTKHTINLDKRFSWTP